MKHFHFFLILVFFGIKAGIAQTNKANSLYNQFENGVIRAKRVIVSPDGWADFVFSDGYQLPSLSDLEKYLREKKHLPDVPSEAAIRLAGLDLGSNQATLLRKIEELTLYVIDLDKRVPVIGNYLQGYSGLNPQPKLHIKSSGTDNTTNSFLVKNSANVELFRIQDNGYIGIGTSSPQSTLAVNGVVTSQKVKVTLNGWADYVFAKEYNLPSLLEVDQYIHKYGHLPGIATESQILSNGLDVGENQVALLGKIEELTLYIIDQQKKISKLEEANKKLEDQDKRIEEQRKEIDELTKMIKEILPTTNR